MTESDSEKKPEDRFKDLIEGADKLDKDRENKSSQSDSPGKFPGRDDDPGLSDLRAPNKNTEKMSNQSTDQEPGPSGSARRTTISQDKSEKRESSGDHPGQDPTEILSDESQKPEKPSLEDTPPPRLGLTPHTPPPALDERGMPLPRRLDEPAPSGSTSPSSIYRTRGTTRRVPPQPPEPTSKFMAWWKKTGPGSWSKGQGWGCVFRMLVIG